MYQPIKALCVLTNQHLKYYTSWYQISNVPKLLNEITQYVRQTFYNYIYKKLNVTKIVVYLIYQSKMKMDNIQNLKLIQQ